jgi:isoquinoline 1-oxidoreductase beta subunit
VDRGNDEAQKLAEEDRLLTRQVLELAAEKSGWGTKSNLGIAVGRFSSHCAQVAEVDVDKGKLIVKNITVAIHCGIAVNPSMVEAQLQGAVVYALQALKYGGIVIRNGRVQQSNFHDYKMIRIDEVPNINIHIYPSTDSPKGVGEPGVPPLAPAVLNALYAAIGRRIRKMPIRKEDLV